MNKKEKKVLKKLSSWLSQEQLKTLVLRGWVPVEVPVEVPETDIVRGYLNGLSVLKNGQPYLHNQGGKGNKGETIPQKKAIEILKKLTGQVRPLNRKEKISFLFKEKNLFEK